jgi:death on curing protein
MKVTVYLTLEEVLYMHGRLIEHYGGAPGVRDLGVVESALGRPRSGYYQTLAEQAAAFLHSFVMGDGFVDGNKRVGFAAWAVFLRMNGYRLEVGTNIAEHFIRQRIIESHADVHEIAVWLEGRMVKLE